MFFAVFWGDFGLYWKGILNESKAEKAAAGKSVYPATVQAVWQASAAGDADCTSRGFRSGAGAGKYDGCGRKGAGYWGGPGGD